LRRDDSVDSVRLLLEPTRVWRIVACNWINHQLKLRPPLRSKHQQLDDGDREPANAKNHASPLVRVIVASRLTKLSADTSEQRATTAHHQRSCDESWFVMTASRLRILASDFRLRTLRGSTRPSLELRERYVLHSRHFDVQSCSCAHPAVRKTLTATTPAANSDSDENRITSRGRFVAPDEPCCDGSSLTSSLRGRRDTCQAYCFSLKRPK
jgi:hypothetical protein